MNRSYIPWALLIALSFAIIGNASAQTPPESEIITPQKRLTDADAAFREANYEKLVPLLEPIARTADSLPLLKNRTKARQLLGVGYYFEAQRATDTQKRAQLMTSARDIFWLLLQEEPEHRLDTFLFPASVVEVFDSVREEHKEDLEKLVEKKSNGDEKVEADVLYIERNVERRLWGLNFLPFGVGQFQNGQNVKGVLFLIAQALSLTVNIGSFLAIESLRDRETGRFSTEPDGGNFATALLWQRIMYGGLAAFGISYAGSVWDGIRFFEETNVRIRSLDEPPPELDPNAPTSGNSFRVPLGLDFQWKF